jgi:hypothetical protein
LFAVVGLALGISALALDQTALRALVALFGVGP